MNQCITDVMHAVRDITSAAASANPANVMASIHDLIAAIKDCVSLVVNFSDACKADVTDLKNKKSDIISHVLSMDTESLKADFDAVKAILMKMESDCVPVPKNETKLPVLQLMIKQKPVTDMNQCMTDVTQAVQDISAAAANANPANVKASIDDLIAAVQDCAGLFVDFSDVCKADFSDLKAKKDDVIDHLTKMDVTSLVNDFSDVQKILTKMEADCVPASKEKATSVNLSEQLMKIVMSN